MIVTDAPRLASSDARRTAEVDFPAPPLELAKDMVGMGGRLIVVSGMMTVGQLSVNSRLLADCHPLIVSRSTVADLTTVGRQSSV
jgi:hypothetical protein